MYGIADIRGFESLVPRSYATFQEYWRNPDTLNARLLGLFNTKYILTGTQMIQDTSLELTRDGAVKIYNNKMIRPRAFMAYKWKIVPNDSKAIRIMEDSSFDGSTVLFHNTVGNNTEQSDSANSEVRIISQEDNSIRLRVTTDKPGFLVLSDTYYPGWHTTVNGKPEEILRANYCMRSVLIPAGESDVKMYFAPHSALWGKWISAGSLVLLFAFVLMSVKRNKSHDNA